MPTSILKTNWLNDMHLTQYKNPLVIYHGNCVDGFGAAWVFHHMQDKIKQQFDFHAGVYQKPPPDVTGRVVYLVDFSYKLAVVGEMCKVADKVILIDHHKTAIDNLQILLDERSYLYAENFSWYVDLERSGAMLAWDYWNNYNLEYADLDASHAEIKRGQPGYKYPPLLLDHIQDRDLWKFKLPHTREIQANLFSYAYDFAIWDKLMLSGQSELLQLSVAGAAIERKHHKDIAELVKVTKHMRQIGAYSVPVAPLPYVFSSDAGHLMAKEYEGGRYFAACYWDTPDGRTYSLRSTDGGMDVSEIAKHYGGGGHKNAAGFSVPSDHRLANRASIIKDYEPLSIKSQLKDF